MASYSTGIPANPDESWCRTSAPRLSTTPTTVSSSTTDISTSSPDSHSIPPPAQTTRTCRICFESIHPEVDSKTGQTIYRGENSEEGRLIRPCKCNGSQRYVHELCLKMYRHSHPLEESYLRCPTCRVGYKFSKSLCTDIAAHPLTHACITLVVTSAAIFVARYAANPLLSITIFYRQTLEYGIQMVNWYTSDHGWLDHFAQGSCLIGIWGMLMIFNDIFQVMRTGIWDSVLFFLVPLGASAESGILWVHLLPLVARAMYGLWCEIGTWARRYVEDGEERVIDLDSDGIQ
jgi:hypothetical protein